jgi:hypothetical protein
VTTTVGVSEGCGGAETIKKGRTKKNRSTAANAARAQRKTIARVFFGGRYVLVVPGFLGGGVGIVSVVSYLLVENV